MRSARRLLLVEDDLILAAGVRMLLEDQGFEVETLHGGRQVITSIARRLPLAVILDVSLPDVAGTVVGASIRRAWPALPIIYITGHDASHELRSGEADSATAVLQKPFEIEALVALIERTAGTHSGR